MHLRCPHCHNAIELVRESPILDVTCPSCGSRWRPAEPGTETVRDTSVKTVGRFQLLELIGTGHFGEVWSALDPTLDRKVAIKLPRKEDLDEDDIERFLREARAAAQLTHPNIVGVHEVGREGELLYIVSDLIDGASLTDWINARRLLSFEETAKLCATLADALHYAHEQGVIHRDLKPSNVLLNGNGEPHLTDFGLAKRESGEITMTIEGRILGTPAYMSPEQARGEGHHADRRSDVYSLGVLLFELLTGQRPFKGNSRLLIHQVLHEDPRPPRKVNSKIPKDLQTICLKAMEKAPSRRYATAKDMADDLRRFLASQPLVAQPIGRWERCRRWRRRNPIVATLLATILVLVTSIGALYARYWHEQRTHAPFTRTVVIDSKPSGARIVFVPLSDINGEPLPERKIQPRERTPVTVRLPPGDYLVEAKVDGGGFHQVYRHVPGRNEEYSVGGYPHLMWSRRADNSLGLEPIKISNPSAATEGMALIRGGSFLMAPLPANHDQAIEERDQTLNPSLAQTSVADFYLDPHEVTIGDYRRVMGRLSEELQREIDAGDIDESWPIFGFIGLPFHSAVMYAELDGKRLPTEAEFEFAARWRGTRRYPWGDSAEPLSDWTFGPVGQPKFDQLPTDPPVFGLYSNVAEWTMSWINSPIHFPQGPHSGELQVQMTTSRVVKGGTTDVANRQPRSGKWDIGPRLRYARSLYEPGGGVGFRCARSAAPRYLDTP